MAFFTESELIASIRHELRLEDDSGVCDRLLAPVTRRAKYGGLPLNFRVPLDDDEEHHNAYEFPLDVDAKPTSTCDVISNRLRSKTTDSVCYPEGSEPVDEKLRTEELFVIPSPKRDEETHTSAVSRFLSSDLCRDNPWIDYGKFQVMGDDPSKNLQIIFTMDEDNIDLPIRVKRSAKVFQVIGVCCLVYAAKKGTVLSGTPSDYQLFMADESGEIDWDFSPIESGRSIGELGFDFLALAKRDCSRHEGYTVKVYFVTNQCFSFEMSSLDNSLGWLRDEAIRRRCEQMNEEEREQFLIIPDYNIESADDFDIKLDPEQTIASAQTLEFVLVRKNSSRNCYHPRGLTARTSGMLSSGTLSPITPTDNRSSVGTFEFSSISPSGQRLLRYNSTSVSSQKDETLEVLNEWKVERLHKYKPKSSARLVLRWNCLEINAVNTDDKRRSIVPSHVHKHVTVPWENVADTKLIERKIHSDTVPVVLLYTLPIIDQKTVSSVLGHHNEMKVQHIGRLYETVNWKVYQLECCSMEEAKDIVQNINEICKGCESISYKIFCHSAGGSRRPALAADACLLQSAEGPVLSSLGSRKKSRFQKLKRMISHNNME